MPRTKKTSKLTFFKRKTEKKKEAPIPKKSIKRRLTAEGWKRRKKQETL